VQQRTDATCGRAQTGFEPIDLNESNIMNSKQIVAIVLIVAGVLGLAYGGFSYDTESTRAKLGPLELKVTEHKTVNVPMWAGIGAIVAGALLLVMGGRKN
jgi:drug/metabolite transporter (DMT)-like permease